MKKIVLFSIALAISSQASSNQYMNAESVKNLFTNKTFDGVFLPKDKKFSVYEESDGTHHVHYKNGKKSKGRTWWINDKGQHCTTNPKWKKKWPNGRCSHVVDAGNGEYHKINDKGKHTHTLFNFRDGNQL